MPASSKRTGLQRRAEDAIDQLPDALRTVFVLRAVEGMAVSAIAAALGLASMVVRNRHLRAEALLRGAFADEVDAALTEVFSFAGARCDRIVAGVLARLDQSHANRAA